jgi:5'-nucleotidase
MKADTFNRNVAGKCLSAVNGNRRVVIGVGAGLVAAAMSLTTVFAQDDEPFKLTLMHTNDTHSHHEPQGRTGTGGAARQATVIKAIRESVDNSILLDAGDRFTGTLFHKYYEGVDNIKVMNALGYDAMALGNHEFDNGLEVLERFVSGVNFPVLSANVDFGRLETLAAKIPASTTLEVAGEQIGIIGLVTAETPDITINFTDKDAITWSDDYAGAVNREVTVLRENGVNKIILVTHIGLGMDKAVAAKVRDVDVIVGGHSHTVVSSIFKEGGNTKYPLSVNDADGKPVYIVQAGDRDRYVGKLDLRFDKEGKVIRARGDLVRLTRYIEPDEEVQALVDELAAPINELKNTAVTDKAGTVVTSTQLMSNKSCRARECLIGSLIADAIRAETGVDIAMQNGGGIRSDIDEGEVTVGEVLTVLPFGNTIATLTLSGADVLASLESGLSRVGGPGGTGRFPQVSGMRYEYDPSKLPGNRVVSVSVLNSDGVAEPLDSNKNYTLATNNFMRTGGDGYQLFNDNAIDPYDYGRPLEEALIDYMIANNPVTVELDGRIKRVP